MRSQETTVLEVHEVAGLAKRSPEDTKNEVLTASLLGGGGVLIGLSPRASGLLS